MYAVKFRYGKAENELSSVFLGDNVISDFDQLAAKTVGANIGKKQERIR